MRILLFCLLLITCLTSCTNTTRMGYGLLDWYLLHKVERIVSLDKAQKKSTKKALKGFHQWHRETQLPLYTQFINSLNQRLKQGPISGEEIHALTDEVQILLDHSLGQLIPATADVLYSLSDKQVIEVIESLEQERQEYIEEYIAISAKKRRKQHQKDLTKYMKRLMGKPNKTQKAKIEQWAKALEPFETLSAEQQKTWQKDIKKLLDNRKDLATLEAGLGELMFYRTDDWAPELEAILDRNQTLTYDLAADLLNDLTPIQREQMHARLNSYGKDFLHLHKKAQQHAGVLQD